MGRSKSFTATPAAAVRAAVITLRGLRVTLLFLRFYEEQHNLVPTTSLAYNDTLLSQIAALKLLRVEVAFAFNANFVMVRKHQAAKITALCIYLIPRALDFL